MLLHDLPPSPDFRPDHATAERKLLNLALLIGQVKCEVSVLNYQVIVVRTRGGLSREHAAPGVQLEQLGEIRSDRFLALDSER